MTKQTFTEKCSESTELGLWQLTAKTAIKMDRVDLYIQHWIDQYMDKGSRHSVESMLSKELLSELKLFICDSILGEDHAMRIKLVSKTTKIAELKKIIADQKVVIDQLKMQIRHFYEYLESSLYSYK
jgi:hypothetical protein